MPSLSTIRCPADFKKQVSANKLLFFNRKGGPDICLGYRLRIQGTSASNDIAIPTAIVLRTALSERQAERDQSDARDYTD